MTTLASMIEINNLSNISVEKRFFSTVAKKVLSGENRKTDTISLAFVGKEEIKNLNKKFRKKNKATDVLSFELTEKKYLGEIIICPEMVKPDKSPEGHFDGSAIIPAERDLARVFIHGILHLCGYEHEKSKKEAEKMEEREKFYLNKI